MTANGGHERVQEGANRSRESANWGSGSAVKVFSSSPQIENSQILGLIPRSQIQKFLRWASHKNTNLQNNTFAEGP